MDALLDMTVLAVATVGALALASAAQWAMLRLAMRSMRPATAAVGTVCCDAAGSRHGAVGASLRRAIVKTKCVVGAIERSCDAARQSRVATGEFFGVERRRQCWC